MESIYKRGNVGYVLMSVDWSSGSWEQAFKSTPDSYQYAVRNADKVI